MTVSELLDAISGRAPKQKDFTHAVESLRASAELRAFMSNNEAMVSELRPSQVADQLLLMASKFLNANVGATIAKNVYDEYSVIFVICALCKAGSKSQLSALFKVFYSVLSNTSKFDMYVRKGSRNMRIGAENHVIELFWLIPLFVNVPVLVSIDVENFIEDNEEVRSFVDGYEVGYAYYAVCGIDGMDKDGYKQFLADGVREMAHTKASKAA
jgi:hypothetical protein